MVLVLLFESGMKLYEYVEDEIWSRSWSEVFLLVCEYNILLPERSSCRNTCLRIVSHVRLCLEALYNHGVSEANRTTTAQIKRNIARESLPSYVANETGARFIAGIMPDVTLHLIDYTAQPIDDNRDSTPSISVHLKIPLSPA